MKDLNKIGEELFSKLRGRFKNITIGNAEGITTNMPAESRFYEFTYGNKGGKVSVSLDEDNVVVMYSEKLFDSNDASMKTKWYDFLKEMRVFAKKRMLNFEVRDIEKSNLEKRDYKFLSNKNGDNTMTESTMYGTSKTSYQNIADARICVKHSESINQELAGGRSQKIGSIYIESANGERFKYPYKHLNGARAMAMHVAEGGNMYDDFGKHIVGLSEEMNKLRKFKTYMSRSSVMAEGLADYMDVVNERIETVKNTVARLQNKKYYKEATENFQSVVLEEVPEDVATDWTAQLTIKQFNEELKSVFPYIYKLVSEANKVKELGPEDLLGEELKDKEDYQAKKKALQDIQMDPNTHKDEKLKKELMRRKAELDDEAKSAGMKETDIPTESDIDAGFEEMMGQFGEAPKPDYIDLDGDGNKKEPMKKAAKDKEKDDDEDNVEEGINTELLGDLESGLEDAKAGNDMSDFIADEIGDYIRAGMDKMGEEAWQDSVEGRACAELDPTDSPEEQAKGFQKAINILKQNEGNDENTNEDMEKDEVMAIMAKHPQDVERMKKDGEINVASGLYTALFRYYSESGDMPYGTQKARDGDPHEFIMDRLDALDLVDEGNAYAHAVRKAKMSGKKKGDKIDHPDPDEDDITLEKEQKIPLPEKILSLFDREQGTFPKGETAVLTMVEKDYGEQYIKPAKAFIEKIMQKYEDIITGPAVQEMEAEHEPGKVTLAVTADINALKRAAGIEETQKTVSNDPDLLNIKALAGL